MIERLTNTAEARRDLALAIVIIAFSGLLFQQADQLPPPFFDPLGSAAVPKFVAYVLATLAVLSIVQRLFQQREVRQEDGSDTGQRMPLVAIGSVLAVVGYTLLLQYDLLSFRNASILFIIVLGSILARFSWRVVRWLLPIAVVLGFAFDFIFTQVFYIDLPEGSALQEWLAPEDPPDAS